MTPEMKKAGDDVIAAVKAHVAAQVAPLLATQRDLLARLDKQSQQLSAMRKELAALQRKAG